MEITRVVETSGPIDKVFAYLSDFTTTNEWDPGTVKTEKVSGDGGVGTTYHNTSRFMGRETELTYVVQTHQPDRLFALRGENDSVIANDSIEISPLGEGARVTYTADFEFKGLGRFVAPLLKPALRKLGDEAEEGLRRALAQIDA